MRIFDIPEEKRPSYTHWCCANSIIKSIAGPSNLNKILIDSSISQFEFILTHNLKVHFKNERYTDFDKQLLIDILWDQYESSRGINCKYMA